MLGGPDAATWISGVPASDASGSVATSVALAGRTYPVRADRSPRWNTDGGPRLLVTRRAGTGEVVLLSSTSPLQNRRLGQADNAALGIALADGRRVVFVEGVHGLSAASGFDAIPSGWRVALFGVPLALLLAAVASSRRIGGAEPDARRLTPSRRTSVDAVGAALERSRQPGPALEPLRVAARRELCRRAGLAETASDAEVHGAALAAGWTPAEAASIITPPDTTAAVLALGRRAGPSPERDAMNEIRRRLLGEIRKVVVGQDATADLILAAISVQGHVLLEGVPGVAKSLLAEAVARSLGVSFRRVQFTPDMLPSDLTGTMTVRNQDLVFRAGPVFTNVLLADEINRTPPKAQSALLEAMQERQVSIDGTSHPLPDPFLVLATQNPIEYEGTYPLPEAQLDRFLLQIRLGYPEPADELAMLRIAHRGVVPAALESVEAITDVTALSDLRALVDATTVSDDVLGYVAGLVQATRRLPSVLLGASPRAAVHLLAASKASARMSGRAFVTPDDVAWMAIPVLRHRIQLRPEAELEQGTPEAAVRTALASVPVPR